MKEPKLYYGPRTEEDSELHKKACAYRDHCAAHQEFDPTYFKQAVILGSSLVETAGQWLGAVQALRQVWTEKPGHNLTSVFDTSSDGLSTKDLLAYLRTSPRPADGSGASFKTRGPLHTLMDDEIVIVRYSRSVDGRNQMTHADFCC